MNTILSDGLSQMGLLERVPAEAPAQLARYGQLLLEKNQVMNLTAIREPEGVARLHMLDCAALLHYADLSGKTLIDVGTGAGFPGLVLKILVPSLEVTLLDSLGKRVTWLNELIGDLGLRGVRAVHARAEEAAAKPPYRDGFDVATARAVAELRLLAELCLPMVKPGGCFLSMKAEHCEEEVQHAEDAVRTLGGALEQPRLYDIPGTDVRRAVVVSRKLRPTPKGYPRRWGRIRSDPL